MSATNEGTPARESWPAISWSVLVLPVPVAPAMRPWRLRIESATWTRASLTGVPSFSGLPKMRMARSGCSPSSSSVRTFRSRQGRSQRGRLAAGLQEVGLTLGHVSRRFRFRQVDVFTTRPLHGNPLAVFTDADGMTDAEMQAVASEMMLSETTFVVQPTAEGARRGGRLPGADLHADDGAALRRPPVDRHGMGFGRDGAVRRHRHGRGHARTVHQEVAVGVLPLEMSAGEITLGMAQPELIYRVPAEELDELAETLEVRSSELRWPGAVDKGGQRRAPAVISCGLPYLVVPISRLDLLADLESAHALALARFAETYGADSAAIVTPGRAARFRTRTCTCACSRIRGRARPKMPPRDPPPDRSASSWAISPAVRVPRTGSSSSRAWRWAAHHASWPRWTSMPTANHRPPASLVPSRQSRRAGSSCHKGGANCASSSWPQLCSPFSAARAAARRLHQQKRPPQWSRRHSPARPPAPAQRLVPPLSATAAASASLVPTAAVTPPPTDAPSPTAAPSAEVTPSPVPIRAPVELIAGGGDQTPANGVLATDALLQRTSGAAFGPDGTVWITDVNLSLLMHIAADGTLADMTTGLTGPEGVSVAIGWHRLHRRPRRLPSRELNRRWQPGTQSPARSSTPASAAMVVQQDALSSSSPMTSSPQPTATCTSPTAPTIGSA